MEAPEDHTKQDEQITCIYKKETENIEVKKNDLRVKLEDLEEKGSNVQSDNHSNDLIDVKNSDTLFGDLLGDDIDDI